MVFQQQLDLPVDSVHHRRCSLINPFLGMLNEPAQQLGMLHWYEPDLLVPSAPLLSPVSAVADSGAAMNRVMEGQVLVPCSLLLSCRCACDPLKRACR